LLETRVVRRALAKLKAPEKNARYMTAAQFDRLVENLKRDGVLTSLPLVYGDTILSGNHRVRAALKAGIVEADVIEVVTPLDAKRRVALQLSHNAITGQDDPNLLSDLYGSLDFDEKAYSGLTDEMLGKIDDLTMSALGIGAPAYEDILLTFLPEDAEQFAALVKRLEKAGRAMPRFVSSLADFTPFFDTLLAVKEKLNIHNTSLAVRMMATLACERLEQIGQEDHGTPHRADAADSGANPEPSPAG
jgi:hypothetical protein